MPHLNSIATRLVAAAAIWVVFALVAGGLLLSNLFREPLEHAFDERLNVLLRSVISTVELGADAPGVRARPLGEPRFLQQYSGLYWQVGHVEQDAVVIRSPSMWDFAFEITPIQGGAKKRSYVTEGPLGQSLQVVEQYVTEEGVEGTFVFTVAADRKQLVETIDEFNTTLLWSLGALGIGLLLAVSAQVRFGLRPLQRIRKSVSDIRDGRAEKLVGEFPSEVKPLADELNSLMDYTTEVLARARAHVGNLAHALKTPLAVLANEAEKPTEKLRPLVKQQTELMRRQIDHHLSRARAVGQAPFIRNQTPLQPALTRLARTLEKIYAERDIQIDIASDDGIAFRGEQHDLDEMLGNLLDNACKWAKSTVRLRAATAPSGAGLRIRITVEDDGPGIPDSQRDALFDRGQRADESKPGSGLGLSIVRDIATLYGGDVALSDSDIGGLCATLTLPGSMLELTT